MELTARELLTVIDGVALYIRDDAVKGVVDKVSLEKAKRLVSFIEEYITRCIRSEVPF